MNNLQELEKKYIELGKEIEKLKDQPVVTYPLYFKSKLSGAVIRFDELMVGEVVKSSALNKIGYTTTDWPKHTDRTKWTPVPYDTERGFYHGQMVYCWNNATTHYVEIRFYDTINKSAFYCNGNLNGPDFDNYAATMPEFMNTAYDSLEGI